MRPAIVRSNALKQLIPKVTFSVERSALPRISLRQPKTPYFYQSIASNSRTFTSTTFLYKKKTRADREEAAAAPSKSSSSPAEIEDPFDYSALNTALDRTLEKLKNDLSKLRTGGRFNPEALEDLRVGLNKESKKTERLGDLAQVIVKGRVVQVLIGEKDHVKPLTTTIQASPLSLTPQPDPHNPLILTVPIPPPTKESRDAALAAASKAGETAAMGIKNARSVCQKRLRGMELKKVVRPDDLRKAGKEMEKVVEKATGELKKIVDTAKKGMEQQ